MNARRIAEAAQRYMLARDGGPITEFYDAERELNALIGAALAAQPAPTESAPHAAECRMNDD